MPNPIKIDFVSDVACPWCAIGLKSLEAAMARVGEGLQVELHFQPFELNPQMAAEGEDTTEHLVRKYGMTAEQVAKNGEGIRARGESLGFEFRMDRRTRMLNTFDAHRLLHWAVHWRRRNSQFRIEALSAFFCLRTARVPFAWFLPAACHSSLRAGKCPNADFFLHFLITGK